MKVAALSSGKGRGDENFPVASFLIRPRHRPPIHAFYRFARAADDVADHPTAAAEEKLQLLEVMRASLVGATSSSREATELREILRARGITIQHGLDLLEAFRRDVIKLRYADWQDLMDYCRYSAMPVGRFVLDVHGELQTAWPTSDALCAALQVINHLQDCGEDYRNLNRVYIPLDELVRAGLGPEVLAQQSASGALRKVFAEMAQQVSRLLAESRPFASLIHDRRLATEVRVIQALAESLTDRLRLRDPLSDRVHHTKAEAFLIGLRTTVRSLFLGPPSKVKVIAVRG